MPSTRASARNESSPKKEDVTAGSKRKADISSPKGSRKATKQTTIEESLAGDNTEHPPDNPGEDEDMRETFTENGNGEVDERQPTDEFELDKEPVKTDDTNGKNEGHRDAEQPDARGEETLQQPSQREKKIASNILEKGIVYFFTRNRVGIEDSDSVGDLQRTFFVLRPLPLGTKLGKQIDLSCVQNNNMPNL